MFEENENEFFADICVGGKIRYLKPMAQEDGYFGGSIGIDTITIRPGFSNGRKSLVKGFLKKSDWNYLQDKGAKPYDYISVGGQMEEWVNKKGISKNINVFDSIINFKSA